MENNILSFKHSCFSGDLIYALASIKAICDVHGDKAVIYQWLNQKGFIYPGAEHPYHGVMMNEYAFDMLKPLIESQHYVKSFTKWQGEKIHLDLDQFRQVKNHMPHGNIVTWIAMACPEMTPKYWEPWLDVSDCFGKYELPIFPWNKIVINRTSRYHGQWIDYFHLKEHQKDILFVGTIEEHCQFCIDWGFDVEHFFVKDFLHLALLIRHCGLFIGNQSMCFAIAEALKVPRLLEVCDFSPNVQPTGDGGYYFRAPETFKYLVDKLLKK